VTCPELRWKPISILTPASELLFRSYRSFPYPTPRPAFLSVWMRSSRGLASEVPEGLPALAAAGLHGPVSARGAQTGAGCCYQLPWLHDECRVKVN
jgi:hypothetical protein